MNITFNLMFINMAPGGIELPTARCKRAVLPLDYEAIKKLK